jgi:tricorn protease
MRIFVITVIGMMFQWVSAAEPVEIRGYITSALSPDGKTLAFEWLNDLWMVSSAGGDAVRVVKDPARDAYPRFSVDGKRLVFSSERTGTLQVYSVKLDGTDLFQHSDHTEGNYVESVSPDGKYVIARGLRSRSGFRAYRLMKIDLKQQARENLLFDATAHSAAISPDGGKVLFCREGEQLYRGAYRGSRASEIHLYDEVEKRFEVMIDEEWEARNPMWCGDGKGFYYLSNVSGEFNVWLRRFGVAGDKQLTFFENGLVLLPSLSADGKVMVFRVGYENYRFEPESGKPPEKIRFFTREEISHSPRKEKVSGTTQVAFGEDGGTIVFSAAGELWKMKMGEKDPVRLTATDDRDEREVQLSADGKTVYYVSDDGLKADVMSAVLGERSLDDRKLIFSNERSKRSLRSSPDGNRLSWLEATGNLVTLKLGDGQVREVMPNWDMPTYDWSPDGKWLVVAAKDVHSNRDIWLVPSDGSQEAVNLTKHPAFEGSPKWSPDGTKIVFTARRGKDEKSRLWLVDLAEPFSSAEHDEASLKKITSSVKRIETEVTEPKRVVWSEDSRSILFQNEDTADERIFEMKLYDGKVSEFANFRGIAAGRNGEGKTYWRCNRVPAVFDGEKLQTYDFEFRVEQERRVRLKLAFKKIWRTLGERFYDETMNGKDWDAVREKYESVAAEARDGREFDRVVAKLLGELNASHLTFHYTPWGMKPRQEEVKNPTAHPGMEFRSATEGALVVERVIPGSPVALLENAPVAGEVVKRIAGRDVDAKTPLEPILNGAKEKPILLVVENQQGQTRTMEMVPVSYGRIRFLDRKYRVDLAKAAAEAKGYVYLPFAKMKEEDLEKLSIEVYRASTHAKGLILDLRDNAGGRVADELLALFCQPNHAFTIPRGGERGYPTDRRVAPSWDGPMVVLANGNTYSNAEIFCHAFKQLGRGKLVGTPTNGGVISAVGVKIPEVGELQIPFRGWFHAQTGKDLELNGVMPDILVPMMPSDQVLGKDPQLDAALKALDGRVSEEGQEKEPKIKSAK